MRHISDMPQGAHHMKKSLRDAVYVGDTFLMCLIILTDERKVKAWQQADHRDRLSRQRLVPKAW